MVAPTIRQTGPNGDLPSRWHFVRTRWQGAMLFTHDGILWLSPSETTLRHGTSEERVRRLFGAHRPTLTCAFRFVACSGWLALFYEPSDRDQMRAGPALQVSLAALLDQFGDGPAVTRDADVSPELLRLVTARLSELDVVSYTWPFDRSWRLRWWLQERELRRRFRERQTYERSHKPRPSVWDEEGTARAVVVKLVRVFAVTGVIVSVFPGLRILLSWLSDSVLPGWAVPSGGQLFAIFATMTVPFLVVSGWGRLARSCHAALFSKLEAPVEGRTLHRRLLGVTLTLWERSRDMRLVSDFRARLRWGVLSKRHSVEVTGASPSGASFYVGGGIALADREAPIVAPAMKLFVEAVERQIRGTVHVASHEGTLRLSLTGSVRASLVCAVAHAAWPRIWGLVVAAPTEAAPGYRQAPDVPNVGPDLLHRILRTDQLAHTDAASEGWWSAARREARWRREDQSLAARLRPVERERRQEPRP